MRRSPLVLALGLAVLALSGVGAAQFIIRIPAPVTGPNPVSVDRLPPANTWETAGAASINDARTQCGATLGASSTVAQINTAISSCGAHQYVQLGTGSFGPYASGIINNGTDHVTLRGNGPQNTQITFTDGVNCAGYFAAYCGRASSNWWDAKNGGTRTVATVSGTFTKGQTSLTFSTVAGLAAGVLVVFDQINDLTAGSGMVVCTVQNTCSNEGGGAYARSLGGTRSQQQAVIVQSVAGSVVTFAPGLAMPNWDSAKAPGAMWGADSRGQGLENLSMDVSGAPGVDGIVLFDIFDSWVKGVQVYKPGRNHVYLHVVQGITVRDSYFDEGQTHHSQSYGVEAAVGSNYLIENNIFHHVTAPMLLNGTADGSVYGYNFTWDNTYYDTASGTGGSCNFPTCNYLIAGGQTHEAGVGMVLFEGNDFNSYQGDAIHGTANLITVLRNRIPGVELVSDGSTYKTQQTGAVNLYAYHRFNNIIGNVLGTSDYHVNYGSGSASVYSLGSGIGSVPSDGVTSSSLMRWGNWDTVTSTNDTGTNDATGTRFVSGEVPTSDPTWPNTVPSGTTVPTSYYLAAKPAFFGTHPWPGIGPDVSGGDLPSTGGHANKIPARLCYDNGAKDGNGKLTAFAPSTCYPAP